MVPDQTDRIPAFRAALLAWFDVHARDFPWRRDRTPYRTAIAELMLRRTRAEQVAPVYQSFVSRYPSLSDAARADPADIQAILSPLGLRWRAQNAVDFIREASVRYGDEVPTDPESLQTLPGAGPYVASAVSCFASGGRDALIDANVVRVLGRVFGLPIHGEARRRKAMRDLARAAVDPQRPADYHYALLDLGATVCTARRPKCGGCPLAKFPCLFLGAALSSVDRVSPDRGLGGRSSLRTGCGASRATSPGDARSR